MSKLLAQEEYIGLICISMVCCTIFLLSQYKEETVIVLYCALHHYKFAVYPINITENMSLRNAFEFGDMGINHANFIEIVELLFLYYALFIFCFEVSNLSMAHQEVFYQLGGLQ